MTNQDIGLFKLKIIQLSNGIFNTFFYLNHADVPTKYSFGNKEIVPLQLRFGNDFEKVFVTSLGPFIAQVPRRYVGACPTIIQRLGLKENDEIFVTVCRAQSLSVITIRPVRQDDYNIMACSYGIMEQTMLDQVRMVAPLQPLVLQFGSVVIDLIVEQIKPVNDHGLLQEHTEVIVTDPSTIHTAAKTSLYEISGFSDLLWRTYSWLFPSATVAEETEIKLSPKEILTEAFKRRKVKPKEYRVVLDNTAQTNDVIYTDSGFEESTPTPCKLSKIKEKTTSSKNLPEKSKSFDTQPFYSMVLSKQKSSSNAQHNEVFLSEVFMEMQDLCIGSRVTIEPLSELPENLQTFKNTDTMKQVKKTFSWESLLKIKHQVWESIECCVTNGYASNVLVTGPSGCGKTFLMTEILNKCMEEKIYCDIVNCKSLRGKKVESLFKIFANKWSECSYREPSVLILDDLDAIIQTNEHYENDVIHAAYGRRVSKLMRNIAEWFSTLSRIELIATASSVSSLDSMLMSVRGPRLFGVVLKIPDLSKNECDTILKELGVQLSPEMLEKTHGFRIQDLSDLVSRCKLRCLLKGRQNVEEKDIKGAFKDTVPRALHGIKVKSNIPYNWDDIGGMENVKKCLVEIFRWPSKYPEIFESSPLRLQTGALLYGPPGCGKTLIAGALANECGMNFRSVKGPELLNKYIGASEANVRKLFEDAHQAQPCLLFFDELDSLAPRRGADSTGVTDRVVNQLLTELDGVEGRAGVWVLGATSRPDLIDPALLRPGRLDRIIFCPAPSADERLHVLQVLSKSMKFADNVRLVDLVAKTDGFTGADLQALLYNCQMKAIKDHPNDENALVVSSSHIEEALAESRTSLSGSDQLKYMQIYKRFQGDKISGNAAVIQQTQKVTLA